MYEGEAVRNIIDNSYNTAAYNVGDYFRCVSDNKLRMRSVYLFDKGGSIKLSHQRGYYAEYRNFGTNGNKYDCQDKRLYKINGNQVDKTKMKSGLLPYRQGDKVPEQYELFRI